jgi:hypothetical protein
MTTGFSSIEDWEPYDLEPFGGDPAGTDVPTNPTPGIGRPRQDDSPDDSTPFWAGDTDFLGSTEKWRWPGAYG